MTLECEIRLSSENSISEEMSQSIPLKQAGLHKGRIYSPWWDAVSQDGKQPGQPGKHP